MRRLALPGAAVLALAASAVPAVASGRGDRSAQPVGSQARVTVGPRAIGPRTGVVVRFRAPSGPGQIAAESITVRGPRHAGCAGARTTQLTHVVAGAGVRAVMRPPGRAGRWCLGRYRGTVRQTEMPDCRPVRQLRVCPMYVIVPRTIATFAFRVAAR